MTAAHAVADLRRTIAVGLVWNPRRDLLLCRMPADRGVFPGQWGLPGGGLEAGEHMVCGLRRELREELGIEIDDIEPAFFKDGQHEKIFADGTQRSVYMIFLVFHCTVTSDWIRLNDEFTEYRWVRQDDLANLDLNAETRDTLARLDTWRSALDRSL